MHLLILFVIKIYWIIIPKAKRRKCIFKKSCSNYVYEITSKKGFIKGLKAFVFRYKNCRSTFQVIQINKQNFLLTETNTLFHENEINQHLLKN